MMAIHSTFRVALLLGGLLLSGQAWGANQDRQVASEINKANETLRSGDVDGALKAYHKVQESTAERVDLSYNMAVAEYRKGDLAKAQQLFAQTTNATDDALAAKSRYNLGNCNYAAALKQAESDRPAAITGLNEAITNYRSALEADPTDADSRANIELASAMIDKLRDQEKKDQQQKDQQQKDQQQKDQQQKDQQQKDQQQKDQQQKDQQQGGEKNEQKKAKQESAENEEHKDKPQNQDQSTEQKEQQNSEQSQGNEAKDQKEQQGKQQKPGENNKPQSSDHKEGQTGEQKQQPKPEESKSDGKDSKEQSTEQPEKASDQKQQSQPSTQKQSKDKQTERNSVEQAGEPQEQEGKAAPKGTLTSADEQTSKDEHNEKEAAAKEMAPDGTMTVQEAEKMLQSIRDQEMIRRLRRQAAERNQHIPVDRDW